MSFKNFIWDWNGTLLDDISLSISILNNFLIQRNLPTVTAEQYREIFDFPVKNYYQAVGFDFNKESFADIGQNYHKIYNANVDKNSLFPDVVETLEVIKNNGGKNYIISARKQSKLFDDIKLFGIENFFDEILGVNDNLGSGKEFLAEDFKKRHKISVSDTVFIGDTTHDFKISQILGCECYLVCRGHQSKERLEKVCYNVVDKISDLQKILLF